MTDSEEIVMPVRRKASTVTTETIPPVQGVVVPTETDFKRKIGMLKGEVGKAIIGKDKVIEGVLIGLLSNGHILLEDFPGLAKTLLANTLARALGCGFKRVQFTPDLMPTDITGTRIFEDRSGKFIFEKGPIFTNILLADEINRAPPKTQAALLEAMQERQVTISGVTYELPRPFIVMATQNPIEYEGTYPLPEAQLDRFIMKMGVGYPTLKDEDEILRRRVERRKDDVDIERLFSQQDLIGLQNRVEEVYVEESVRRYIVEIVQDTRKDPRMALGSSPRGSLALLKMARARALIHGRGFIIPDDVKANVVQGLAHRVILKPEFQIKGVTPEQVIRELLERVTVPKVENYVD